MKALKKVLATILSLTIILSLCACGNNVNSNSNNGTDVKNNSWTYKTVKTHEEFVELFDEIIDFEKYDNIRNVYCIKDEFIPEYDYNISPIVTIDGVTTTFPKTYSEIENSSFTVNQKYLENYLTYEYQKNEEYNMDYYTQSNVPLELIFAVDNEKESEFGDFEIKETTCIGMQYKPEAEVVPFVVSENITEKTSITDLIDTYGIPSEILFKPEAGSLSFAYIKADISVKITVRFNFATGIVDGFYVAHNPEYWFSFGSQRTDTNYRFDELRNKR